MMQRYGIGRNGAIALIRYNRKNQSSEIGIMPQLSILESKNVIAYKSENQQHKGRAKKKKRLRVMVLAHQLAAFFSLH